MDKPLQSHLPIYSNTNPMRLEAVLKPLLVFDSFGYGLKSGDLQRVADGLKIHTSVRPSMK